MHHTSPHDYFIKKEAGNDVGEENAKIFISPTWKEQNVFTQFVPVNLKPADMKICITTCIAWQWK